MTKVISCSNAGRVELHRDDNGEQYLLAVSNYGEGASQRFDINKRAAAERFAGIK